MPGDRNTVDDDNNNISTGITSSSSNRSSINYGTMAPAANDDGDGGDHPGFVEDEENPPLPTPPPPPPPPRSSSAASASTAPAPAPWDDATSTDHDGDRRRRQERYLGPRARRQRRPQQQPATSDEEDEDHDVTSSSFESFEGNAFYNWRRYAPSSKNLLHFWRWMIVGGAAYHEQTDDEIIDNLSGLARCISLIRQYLEEHGMPEDGGPKEQEMVLREVTRDLYLGGAPLWALGPIMDKVAEGLTGERRVNWLFLPRKAFVFSPVASEGGATSMFTIQRGFDFSRLEGMERVAVRLASYASNTDGVGNVPSRFPKPDEFDRIYRQESVRNLAATSNERSLERKILTLASKNNGVWFYVNSKGYMERTAAASATATANAARPSTPTVPGTPCSDDDTEAVGTEIPKVDMDPFWIITDREQELFRRLVTRKAVRLIRKLDAEAKPLYPWWIQIVFRAASAGGAAIFWFNGGWVDALVAAVLSVLIAYIAQSPILSRQEKLVYEIIASLLVGIIAGLIALKWPQTCFGAMAIGGVLDILQGFRVVYAVIETMSKHTVAGGADLLEGILYTGLIAYYLRFGQIAAKAISGVAEAADADLSFCSNGLDSRWFILFVPLASLSWSGLFTPYYRELLPMTFHGVLAYGSNYGLSKAGLSEQANIFVSASIVSLSAGIISRFTGRQAVGNTVAGLYALLPGAYLVRSLFSTSEALSGGFFFQVIEKAVGIGIGAWTGSVLCSPALIGTTRGLLNQEQQQRTNHNGSFTRNREGVENSPATMLFF